MEYYNMPLQNCAIAAMQLPESPHLEQRVFIVLLRHKRDPSQPVWNKFEVVNIGMYHLSEVPHVEICSYDVAERSSGLVDRIMGRKSG
jgi:hypothetical protein